MRQKQANVEGVKINYKAGIYLEYKAKQTTLFLKEETLIGSIEGRSSYPKQINYLIGIKHKIDFVDIILKHECLHPIDGTSGGAKARSYDLIEGRINF